MTALDLETFYPWSADKTSEERKRRRDGKSHVLAKNSMRNAIRLITVNTGNEVHTFDLFNQTVPDAVGELIRTDSLVIHNAEFDVTVLRRHGFEVSTRIFDTMLAARLLSLGKVNAKRFNVEDELLDEEEIAEMEESFNCANNDLATIVRRYLGVTMDKAKEKLGASDWGALHLTEAQYDYAAADVMHLPDLVRVLTRELKTANLWNCFLARSKFANHLNDIKFNGVPVNQTILAHDLAMCSAQVPALLAELRKIFSDYRPAVCESRLRKSNRLVRIEKSDSILKYGNTRVIDGVLTEEFNPNTAGQSVAALALHGIEVPNAQKRTLGRFDTSETRALIEYSERKTRLSKIKEVERSVCTDGRVYASSWNQLAAVTGRIHTHEPNFQNLPRDWRDAFEAPDPYMWLKVDLSQIEVYILAIHTHDENLIATLAAGRDVYTEVAAKLFSLIPEIREEPGYVSKALRKVAKTLVLGIAYCLSPRAFVKRVEEETRPAIGVPGTVYELAQAEEFFETFFTMFPRVLEYQERMEAEAGDESVDAVISVTGQRRFLPPLLDDQSYNGYWPSLQSRKRRLVNTPIQAGAACHFVRSINKFAPLLDPRVQIVNIVHDEVNILVTEETWQHTVEVVRRGFEEAFAELFRDKLKAKMEFKIGTSWANGVDIEKASPYWLKPSALVNCFGEAQALTNLAA